MGSRIVIIGAGQSGLQAAESLRTEGWNGELTLLGDEQQAPYHRPPLSKAYLLGDMVEAQLTMRDAAVFDRKQITLRTGNRVTQIDASARMVHVRHGEPLPYDHLVIATGARARVLQNVDMTGVHTLRSLDDACRIRAALAAATSIVVIGAGFIGLEFAAAATTMGKRVTMIESADRMMSRAVSPLMSETYRCLHATHGVEIRLGQDVAGLEQRGGQVTAVSLRDGCSIPADLVLLAIGAVPHDELARAAGLACDRGIIVDSSGRTSDPVIFACGDCTATRLHDGSLRRLESVQSALEQARSVAAAMMGKERPFLAAPWFWSDQYGVKLQMVGTSAGADHHVVRGNLANHEASVFYFRGEQLIGVDSMNRPADHMASRKILDQRIGLTPEQAADEKFPLNRLVQKEPV